MNNIERSFAEKARATSWNGVFDAEGNKAGWRGTRAQAPATTTAPAPSLGERATSIGRMVGRKVGKAGLTGREVGASSLIAPALVGAQGLAMDADGQRSAFYDSPDVGIGAKIRQGARDVAELGLPAAGGVVGGTAGAVAGPVGAVGGGVLGAGLGAGASRLIQTGLNAVDRATGGTGQSPLDDFKASRPAAPVPVKDGSEIIGPNDPRYAQLMATPHGGVVGQDELPSSKIDASIFKANPFQRAATPAAELARQSDNFNRFEAPINDALAERVKASGGSSFRDGAAQALFNAKQGLNGSGIKVTNENGTPTFTGDNRAGGGQLYRAADGSVTSDWSKTQAYADATQRNAADQTRLAELTRGAALSGDREAVARLTAGDQRLAGIAKEAETEKSLRDAVKGGSRNAALALADMEKRQSDAAYKQADISLRGSELAAKREDQGLARALQLATLNASRDAAVRAAEKDAREDAQSMAKEQRAHLEKISVGPDGKFDATTYQNNVGRAANLKPQPGQTDDQVMADKASYAGLVTNLDNGQWAIDRLFASPAGTDPEKWYANDGIRGGFVTDSGKHISNAQLRSLPTDQQRMFRELLLDRKSIPKKYRDQLKGE